MKSCAQKSIHTLKNFRAGRPPEIARGKNRGNILRSGFVKRCEIIPACRGSIRQLIIIRAANPSSTGGFRTFASGGAARPGPA
jgi:hypothetical protein